MYLSDRSQVRTTVLIFVLSSLFIIVSSNDGPQTSHQITYFDRLREMSNIRQMRQDLTHEEMEIPSQLIDGLKKITEILSFDSGFSRSKKVNLKREESQSILFGVLEELQRNGIVSSCINDTGRLLASVIARESWTVPFLDSAGKPGPSITKGWLDFVGNWDQCKAAVAPPPANQTVGGFTGNYCDVQFYIPKLAPLRPHIGLCYPSSCSGKEIDELVLEIVKLINVTAYPNVQCITGETKVTGATVAASIIISVIGCLVLYGTIYDLVFVYLRKKLENNEDAKLESAGYETIHTQNHSSSDTKETSPLIQKTSVTNNKQIHNQSTAVKILLAFSAFSNAKKVLNTSQASGSLGSIHGIRFLSMSWVVLGHTFLLFGVDKVTNYSTEYPKLLNRSTFDAITNALVSVDTFFTLSGLLTSYLTIRELQKRGPLINWGLYYFHRFWRLTPPYMFALLIVLGFQQYFGDGPFWGNVQPADKASCDKYWWRNLLYINNFGNDVMCFGHSWYLANDMQFFVISPLLLVPFCFHWMAGVGSCCVVLLASWITTGVLSYQHNWHTGISSGIDPTWFKDYYVKPWCRIGPYIVGVLAGFILAKTKGKPFRMHWSLAVTGWVVATASALAVLYGVHGDITGAHPLSRGVAAFYNTVSRTVWGACVCWVIVACSAGYGGPVNALLSWSPFVVLGRLTYMTYLIHLSLLAIFFGNLGQPIFMNDTLVPVVYVGMLVICNMCAFVFMLFLESPMIGLEKVLLAKQRKD